MTTTTFEEEVCLILGHKWGPWGDWFPVLPPMVGHYEPAVRTPEPVRNIMAKRWRECTNCGRRVFEDLDF